MSDCPSGQTNFDSTANIILFFLKQLISWKKYAQTFDF